ncbi:manganese/iron transport system permease protein/iron/zinc/copper transport system permease protein [Nitrosomonas aestuarii]|uniref:Manganese/iron transport system permease protein/iron/zinc/copper transport system permease protein n=1 Tax=Nitrosomonas aestuarii TaxID=52441 RepID=A0A1I4AL80_9PROT|nr:metal ABC transporter permease [Nitrosomonas aestuarii]SFK56456.1 manganese/iron transport system permease protein/iron/zinc/copper transport system permease protein [Nitrosomonas aestuarii]
MQFLLEPLDYAFFRHGLLAAVMVGALCGLIGVHVVLRGMSYVGHGLSHAAFGGAVIGFVFSFNYYVGAGAMGLLAALLINQMTKNRKIKSDAAIGIVTTAMFALGVVIISQQRTLNRSLDSALFGNILGITGYDLIIIGLVTAATMATMFFLYRPLLFSTFDNEAAKIFGIKTEAVQLIFALLLTLSIIVSMNIVGVTMIAATLIMPAMTARMMTDSFSTMQLYSIAVGALIGAGGMYLSYAFDIASGATIVLFGALIFCFAVLIRHIREKRMLHANMHRHGNLIHSHPRDNRCDIQNDADEASIKK